jgi:ectoine hydroxylase-related dioxygenase (phytanoyl-CoA dioxygenase family)
MESGFEPAKKRIKVKETADDDLVLSLPLKRDVPSGKFDPIYKKIITYPLETAPHRIDFEETDKWHNYLQENGYVVIKNVLLPEKVKEVRGKVWDFLESLGTGIKRDDKSTWANQNWPNTFSNGIISQYGVGQSEASWTVRVEPRLRQVYETIFGGSRELLVSFDGINVFRPPSDSGKEKWVTTGLWPHLDQNYHMGQAFQKQGVSVQGAVNLIDSGPEDGGFICVSGSNKLFEHIYTTYEFGGEKRKGARHFVQMKPDHEMWTTDEKLAKLSCVKVSAGAGDLILWDSTVLHWNTPVTNLNKRYEELARCAVYVCMAPVEQVSRPGQLETLRKLRLNCIANFKSTSHWPTICSIPAAPRWPRKKPLKPIDIEGPRIPSKTATTDAARHLILGTAPK